MFEDLAHPFSKQEGFARYFQYSATEYLFPDDQVWTRRVQTKSFGDISFYGWPYGIGMSNDFQGLSPPPVVLDLNGTASGSMLYEKGASINRMVEIYLGHDVFYQILAYHVHIFLQPTLLLIIHQSTGPKIQIHKHQCL